MINLTPEGGEPIPLRSLELERTFNRPHLWYAQPANFVMAGLALEAGAASWTIEHEEDGVLKDNLVIVSSRYGLAESIPEREHRIVLRDAELPGSVPRYHLYKEYPHLLGLLRSDPLNEAVLIADPDTVNTLESFTTKEEFVGTNAPTSLAKYILQTGLTDTAFVKNILGQWNLTHPDKRMVLSYGEQWRVVGSWAREQAPGEALFIDDELRLYSWSELPGSSGELLNASVITYQVNKLFEAASWSEAIRQPLPHYLERSGRVFTVGSRRDVIRPARSGAQNIEWQIDLFSCADDWPVEDHPLAPNGFASGYRTVSGIVKECTQKSVTVVLDGCSQDQAEVICHLTTLSTGPDRARGIHMPPYPDARVLVAVPTGLFTGPPVFMGDVRESDAPGADPSVMFDAPVQVVSGESITLTNNQVSVVLEGSEANVGSA